MWQVVGGRSGWGLRAQAESTSERNCEPYALASGGSAERAMERTGRAAAASFARSGGVLLALIRDGGQAWKVVSGFAGDWFGQSTRRAGADFCSKKASFVQKCKTLTRGKWRVVGREWD